MVKYISTALALKAFSCCPVARRFYRYLGNTYGVKKRLTGNIPEFYISRIKRFLDLNDKYKVAKDGDHIIEIGTGWLHWEAITIKLFFDVEATCFDVWDNRQFAAMQRYYSNLASSLSNKIDLTNRQRARAQEIIKKILTADSFDTLYERLCFKYVVDTSGTLDRFPDQAFNAVVSAGVLEHIKLEILSHFIKDFFRILKVGGFSIHSINIRDHLYEYDKRVSCKEYLRFSDSFWRFFFQNEVQYINRQQKSAWLNVFDQSGLTLIEELSESNPIGSIKINRQFSHLEKDDLECTDLEILHQRAPR